MLDCADESQQARNSCLQYASGPPDFFSRVSFIQLGMRTDNPKICTDQNYLLYGVHVHVGDGC